MNSSATLFSTTHTGSAMQRMPAQPKVELMMPRGGALERGVGEHEAVVLGLGLGLDALAVGGGDRVDVLADAVEPTKLTPRTSGWVEQDLGLVTRCR